jgi:CRISPR/Cas system-associated exonuclease Cas4 (RecB family)
LTLEIKTGKSYVSHSGLSTWLNCGWQFYLSRIQKVPENPSYWLVGGSSVHEATEVYDVTGTENFDPTIAFNEAWKRNYERSDNGMEFRAGGRSTKAYPNGEDATWWLTEGPKQVDRWVQFRKDSGYQLFELPDGRPAIEVVMDQEVSGVPVKAVLDRLFVTPNGELIVVDIKTGSREPASKMQMGIYAIMVEKTFGVRPVGGAYWMSRTGELTDTVNLDNFTEPRLGSWVKNFEKAIDNNIYIPAPGFMCGTCGVNSACYVVNGKDSHKYPEITEGEASEQ